MPQPTELPQRTERPARGFGVLTGAYAVTSFGSYLNLIVLNLYAYELTGRAAYLGLLMLARLASGALAGVLASRLLARTSYRQVMIWASVVPAVVLAALAAWPAVPLLVVAVVAQGAGSTLFLVALRSSVPELVGVDERAKANSSLIGARSIAMVAGFASAGVILPVLGYGTVFLIDAASFAVCAVAVAVLRFPGNGTANHERPEVRASGAWRRPPSGTVVALPVLLIVLRAFDALGSASHNTGMPVYSALLNPAHPAIFASRFWTAWAVGCVAVQILVRRFARHGRHAGARAFVLGTIGMSAAFVLGFAGFPLAVTLPVAVLAGCADGYTEAAYAGHLQTLPPGVRDRAFGRSAIAENAGFGLGTVATSALLERYRPFVVVAASHTVVILAALVCLLVLARGFVRPVLARRSRYVAATDSDHRDGVQAAGRRPPG